MILGDNNYWDGCIVKILSTNQGYECEIAVFSPEMMIKRPARHKIGANVGCWGVSKLQIPKNFCAQCPHCETKQPTGHSLSKVSSVGIHYTFFECAIHGHSASSHKYRSAEEAKWLTPASKGAWLHGIKIPKFMANAPSIDEILLTPSLLSAPTCTCDVFNFGCTCPALQHEKNEKS